MRSIRSRWRKSRCPSLARSPTPSARRPGRVLDGTEDRLRRSAGRSYPDLVRLRTGRLDSAPDAVLRPADVAGVEAVLAACASSGIAVVPYGGGTSVVGGVDAVADGHRAVVSVDLSPAALSRARRRIAHRPPRPGADRAAGGGGAPCARAHARALPAVLRAGHDRRLRRDPLGRPGLQRLRTLRRARHLTRAHALPQGACVPGRPRTRPPAPLSESWPSAPRAPWG